jgi:methyl-accepting chemotaxis protein
MFDKLNHLKIWQKLALVSALLAVPVFALLYVFVAGQDRRIAHTQRELDGLEYVSALRELMELTGAPGDSSRATDAALAKVDAVDARLANDLGVAGKWPEIRKNWRNPAALQQWIVQIGENSNLRADEARDVFALADTVLSHGPVVTEAVQNLQNLGQTVSSRGSATGDEAGRILYYTRTLERANASVKRDLEVALAGEAAEETGPSIPSGRISLRSASNNAVATAERLRAAMDAEILAKPEAVGLATTQIASLVSGAAEDYGVLQRAATERIRSTLNRRLGDVRDEKYAQIVIGILVLVFAGAIIFSVNLGITRQLRSILKTFDAIRVGNYQARSEEYYADELGKMAGSLNNMLDQTVSLIQSREEKEQIQRSIMKLLDEVSGVAQGDLRKEAEVTADVTGAIADSFNYMIVELRGLIRSVQDTSLAVGARAIEMETRAESLAEGSAMQSSQIAEASRTIEQINDSIRQVAAAASTAAEVAGAALEHARGGALSVRQTINGMDSIRGQVQETAKRVKRLGESSQEIGEITQLIGDIADRTSILALNASIQAAAAGDAGRGFAVVAEEVERLAERATQSTKRIAALIRSVQADTNEAIVAMEKTTREVVGGSQLANDAGAKLGEIESVSQRISALVNEILEASRQQARNSDAVTRKVAGVADFTADTASNARDVENSVVQLAALSRQLTESMGRFKLPEEVAETERQLTLA